MPTKFKGIQVKASIDGIAKFNRQLKQFGDEFIKVIKDQVKITTIQLANNAKIAAPTDTGRLKNSYRTLFSADGLVGTAGTNVDYAPSVEFGTGKQSRVPAIARQAMGDIPQAKNPRKMPPPGALRLWAKNHGMAGAEFAIARKIGREGTKPQPHLFLNMQAELERYVLQLEAKLNRVIRRHNNG